MVDQRNNLFAIVIGLMDGILTALALAAGRIIGSGDPISLQLALRISTGGAISGIFIFFVAEYARQRSDLVVAEMHLRLSSKGQLAASALGRSSFNRALVGAAVSGTCSFAGALLPLLPAAVFPRYSWLALVAALIALVVLGTGLAKVASANPLRWATALLIIGGVLIVVGNWLHIV